MYAPRYTHRYVVYVLYLRSGLPKHTCKNGINVYHMFIPFLQHANIHKQPANNTPTQTCRETRTYIRHQVSPRQVDSVLHAAMWGMADDVDKPAVQHTHTIQKQEHSVHRRACKGSELHIKKDASSINLKHQHNDDNAPSTQGFCPLFTHLQPQRISLGAWGKRAVP